MLAKDQTAGVCTAERYTFTVTHDFGMLWKQHASLTSSEKEVKNGLHIQELLNAILLPATLAIVKVLRLFFFFFIGLTALLAEYQFLNLGLNLCPQQWKLRSLNHWTAREFPSEACLYCS